MRQKKHQNHYYLKALKNHIETKQSENKRLSIRAWARLFKFAFPGTLSNILTGRRVPNKKTSEILIAALKLSPYEKKLWNESIAMARSAITDVEDDQVLVKKIKKKRFTLAEAELLVSFDSYLIFDAVSLEGFKPTAEWLNSNLYLSITQNRVEEIIDLFLRKKIFSLGKNGKLKKLVDFLDYPSGVASKSIKKFHLRAIEVAISALKERPPEQRQVTTSTLMVDEEAYQKMCIEIEAFRHMLLEKYDGSGTSQILIVSTQLFPALRKSLKYT